MNITLRQIKYFVSTAESGSLSTAAKSLNISQSAITTAIQGLERDIGYKLLIRSKSGVDLTDEEDCSYTMPTILSGHMMRQ